MILFNSERKHFQAYIASFSFLLCTIFFAGHTILVQKNFIAVLNHFHKIIYPSFLLISSLPFFWFLLVINFYTSKRIFKSVTNRQIFFLISFCLFVLLQVQFYNSYYENHLAHIDKFIERLPDKIRILFSLSLIVSTTLAFTYILQAKLNSANLKELAKAKSFSSIFQSTLLLMLLSLIVSFGFFYQEKDLLTELKNLSDGYLPILIFLYDFIAMIIILSILLIIGKSIREYQLFTNSFLIKTSNRTNFRFIFLAIFCLSLFQSIGIFNKYYINGKEILIGLFFLLTISVLQKKFNQKEISQKTILKPFFFRENLYDIIFKESKPDLEEKFIILCQEYLKTNSACFTLLGKYSYLLEKPICYPFGSMPPSRELTEQVQNSMDEIVYLSRSETDSYVLCLKIFENSDAIAYLYLGIKKDYSLYSEDEIEIAKFGIRNLLEVLTIIEISKILYLLQKKQVRESRLIDNQIRRELHDEILPEIQSAMIALEMKNSEFHPIENLSMIHKKISSLLKFIPETELELNSENFLNEINLLGKKEFIDDQFSFINEIETDSIFINLDANSFEIIYFAIREFFRNSKRYAKKENEVLHIHFNATTSGNLVIFSIKDNGKGINLTTSSKGSGSGILLHSALLASIGCVLKINSIENEFTEIILKFNQQG